MVRVAVSLIWANQVLSDEVQTDFMIQFLAMKRDPGINKAIRYRCNTFIMGIRMVDGGWSTLSRMFPTPAYDTWIETEQNEITRIVHLCADSPLRAMG
jgi:hypothetical protein